MKQWHYNHKILKTSLLLSMVGIGAFCMTGQVDAMTWIGGGPLLPDAVAPYDKTVASDGFPSVPKDDKTTNVDVKDKYWLDAPLVDFNHNVRVINQTGEIVSSGLISIGGSLYLYESPENSKPVYEAKNYGSLKITSSGAKHVTLSVGKNWFGGNDDTTQDSAHAHKLFLSSQWNALPSGSTETNTGLDSDLVVIGGNVYGYTAVVPNAVDGKQGPGTSTIVNPQSDLYALAEGQVGEGDDGKRMVSAAPLITVKGKSQYEHSFFGTLNLADGTQAQLLPYDNGKEGKDNVHGFTWGFVAVKPILNDDGTYTIPKLGTSLREDVPVVAGWQDFLRQSTFSLIGTLHDREGERRVTADSASNVAVPGMWARLIGQRGMEKNYSQFSYDDSLRGVQLGVPVKSKIVNDGKAVQTTSLSFAYLDGTRKVTDSHHISFDEQTKKYTPDVIETGRIQLHGFGFGVQQTNERSNGDSYQDWVAQMVVGHGDMDTPILASSASTRYRSYVLSYEAGRALAKKHNWVLQGQTQLALVGQNTNDFESSDLAISEGNGRNLLGRLGLRYYRTTAGERNDNAPYVSLDVYHNFSKDDTTTVGTGTYRLPHPQTWFALGFGGQHYLNHKQSYVYGNVKYARNLDKQGYKQAWQVNAGWHGSF